MALQWMILSWVVAAEAAVSVLVTLPAPRLIRSRIVALASLLLQPLTGVLPFAAFQLLDLHWKNEHRLICAGDVCTTDERIRYEKSVHRGLGHVRNLRYLDASVRRDLKALIFVEEMFKAQRNVILCVMACLLYWCIYRVCKYHKEIKELEEVEKRLKEQ